MRVQDIESIRIKLASPEDILSWSYGEVQRAETINYRTQRPEKNGLFCEKIFGPVKDYECACGKYKRVRYKGITCDKCGVEVIKSSARRERMGHIALATACSHIWFLKGVPSRIGMILDIPLHQLEKVIYFASYIITEVNEEARDNILKAIDDEFEIKLKAKIKDSNAKTKQEKEVADELKKSYEKAKQEVVNLKPLKIISEIEYHNFSLKYGEVFKAGSGAESLRKIFENIDLKKTEKQIKAQVDKTKSQIEKTKMLRRLKFVRGIIKSKVKPEYMFLTVIPIIPPDLRPMVQLDGGRYASSDLNDLYRRVINRNNRLKYLLEISAPEVIVKNEKRMLQEAVDALIDNTMRRGGIMTQASVGGRRLLKSLADMLKGKQGRFRQNLLGKRVDYSGRSVIVVGPELKFGQCGLPKKMALELFKPFVIKEILSKELAYNVKGASRLIEDQPDEIWAILEQVVKNKLVLLNRAPTLHRLGIQAFYPMLIEGEAIRLHPLVCKAFNADFDGDQMPVHLPLSTQAQKEAKELMLSNVNLLSPATGSPIVVPSLDMVLGCYWITGIKDGVLGQDKLFSSKNEAILAYDTGVADLRAKVKVRMKSGEFLETSVGRILFNISLPDGFPFVNEKVDSKKLKSIVSDLVINYENKIATESLDKIKSLGFEYSTISGITWGIGDLVVPKEKVQLLKNAEKNTEQITNYYKKGLLSQEEKTMQIIEVWQNVKIEIEKIIPKTLPEESPVSIISSSGAKGSLGQIVQMCGMKGLVINPAGKIIELPVKNSYKEGLGVLEYFVSTHGARKGTTDTALRTATAGYLTRRLVDVSHEVIVSEQDCKTKKSFILYRKDADKIGQDFIYKIFSRTAAEEIKKGNKVIVKKGEIIDLSLAREINKMEIEKVEVRSPLTCESKIGICQKCYGLDVGRNKMVGLGSAVGVVAAQAIGEPGTQLTMRTFHTGGVASGGDITHGLPRVAEIFECRVPKGKAIISMVEGVVEEVEKQGVISIKIDQQEDAKTEDVKTEDVKTKTKTKIKAKNDIIEYKIPFNKAIFVKKGDKVKKGKQLCEGNLDLKELLKATDPETTKRYIIGEIQRIYVSQGATIHDKHIEVVITQMFSRVKILNGAESLFLDNEIVSKKIIDKTNNEFKKEKKELIKVSQVLLGISKVSLTTESFLSAASFQETSRVLIRAALEAKEDKLLGLKENVMIGKLIPVGKGFKKPKKE